MTDVSPVPDWDTFDHDVVEEAYDSNGWAVRLDVPDDEFVHGRRQSVGLDGQSWLAWQHGLCDQGHGPKLDFLVAEGKAVQMRRSGSRGCFQFRKDQHREIEYRDGWYVLAIVDTMALRSQYVYGVVASKEVPWSVVNAIIDDKWSYRVSRSRFGCDVAWSRFFDQDEVRSRWFSLFCYDGWQYFK